MFTKTIILATLAALAAAAPTPQDHPTLTRDAPRATHSVVAGRGGLHFDPDNIVAEVGDIVEFHFTPKNHTVVESSFANPCVPKDAWSFDAGFFPVAEGQSDEVFQIEVKDTNPIWFYCAQNNGRHCQSGMTGVINQKFDSAFTLAKHRELAAAREAPSEVQGQIQGGWRIPNPNPLSGF